MSVLHHQPGAAVRDAGRLATAAGWWLLGAAVAVLIPTLLYYGGGWLQYGYRYFLDSVPFVMALCGLAAVHRGGVGAGLAAADRVRLPDRRGRRVLGVQPVSDGPTVAAAGRSGCIVARAPSGRASCSSWR